MRWLGSGRGGRLGGVVLVVLGAWVGWWLVGGVLGGADKALTRGAGKLGNDFL